MEPLILYHCPKCKTGFSQKADCEKHMKIHENEKSFVRISLYLNGHLWKYHRETITEPDADDSVRQYDLVWFTDTENTPTDRAKAKKRLKERAINDLREHIEAITKLETGETK